MSVVEHVYSKPEIKKSLAEIMQQVTNLSSATEDKKFLAPFGEKWSMAENLEHLILSNGAIMKTLSYPIEKLVAKFGQPQHEIRSGVEMEQKYDRTLKSTGLKSTAPFNPSNSNQKSKKEILEMWEKIGIGLQKGLDNWSEEDLDAAQVPHPLMGNFTIREFMFFTIFHTDRHLKAMKNILV